MAAAAGCKHWCAFDRLDHNASLTRDLRPAATSAIMKYASIYKKDC
jgi:hypothetical protein